ncbi:MAG: hypothetical protein RR140_00175 [Clostridia bacterium]
MKKISPILLTIFAGMIVILTFLPAWQVGGVSTTFFQLLKNIFANGFTNQDANLFLAQIAVIGIYGSAILSVLFAIIIGISKKPALDIIVYLLATFFCIAFVVAFYLINKQLPEMPKTFIWIPLVLSAFLCVFRMATAKKK